MGFILFCKGDDYVHITSSVGESFKARLVIVAIPPHLTGERINSPSSVSSQIREHHMEKS